MKLTRNTQISRRRFLRKAALAGGLVAVPEIVGSTALGAGGRPAASERIVMGTIGFGGRGSHVMPAFMREDDVQMIAVCDVKGNRRKLARDTVNRHYGNTDCDAYIDLRELLARDDIDRGLLAFGGCVPDGSCGQRHVLRKADERDYYRGTGSGRYDEEVSQNLPVRNAATKRQPIHVRHRSRA